MSERRPSEQESPVTFAGVLMRAVRGWRPRRPVSLFLMGAMLVVLILGAQVWYVIEDPKGFAFFLSLYFVFFLVVIGRAVADMFDIVREHVRDRERIFKDTFANDGFAQELGQRVSKGDRSSWPEF